jgi:hypothetical protein
VVWDEIHIPIWGHHLSAGTIRHKLVEFLEPRHRNHFAYEYTQEFNILAQYGRHPIDSNAYNDQEGTMNACEVVEDRVRLSSIARGSILSCRTA